MSYQTGKFKDKEPERRKIRDQKRDEFFAEFGVERLSDPFAINADPSVQHNKTLELIELAMTKQEGENSSLEQLKALLLTTGFGIPLKPPLISNLLKQSNADFEALQGKHFDMSWAGWFDD